MLRAGLLLLMVAGASHPARAECANKDNISEHVTVRPIRLGDGIVLPVVTRRIDYGDGNPHNKGAEILVLAGPTEPACTKVIYRQEIEVAQGIDAHPVDFPWFRGIDIVLENNGDPGPVYYHLILRKLGGKLINVTPNQGAGHSSLGGFYFGSLGHGRGNGIAFWSESYADGDQQEPFPYFGVLYRWNASAFQLIEKDESRQKYAAKAAASEFLGLPTRNAP